MNAPRYTEGRCKSCGAKIWWIQTRRIKDNKIQSVPVDAVAPCYIWNGTSWKLQHRQINTMAKVLHFATCPNASVIAEGKKP